MASEPVMTFNELLTKAGFDLSSVMVLRHRPSEAKFRRVLPWLASEKPAVFNAYQQNQDVKVEKAMKTARYVASFIGHKAGQATFVGLYRVQGWKEQLVSECELYPEVAELYTLGTGRIEGKSQRTSIAWFDLQLTDHWADWKGKLIVSWPGSDRAWARWANKPKNTFTIFAIRETSAFQAAMDEWDELVLSWAELNTIPTPWKDKLSEWRGIYYIFDTSLGRGYVGSAYGTDNILGRWLNYADSGHGDNQRLKKLDPQHFRFSILQRLSPDALKDEVIHCENTWKDRLHTRGEFGLNGN